MTKPHPARVVQSAGGVVIRRIDGVPHVLVIRDPYKKWGLPKGHSEGAERIHKFATFFLMFSEDGDPVPQRSEGITEAKWVRLTVAHGRISYQNAAEVVKVAQERYSSEWSTD